jgi:hypothetical protein
MLRFSDKTQVRINCLEEVLAEIYSGGREPNKETAEEILDSLEKHKNYIPPSARREYRSVLLKEYKDYVAERKNKAP